MLDYGHGLRTTLPSINHLDLDKVKTDHSKYDRPPVMSSLSLSTMVSRSPPSAPSGPPPPYSLKSNPPYSTSMQERSHHVAPLESSRDDHDPRFTAKSLPSIQEALGGPTLLQTGGPAVGSQPPSQQPSRTAPVLAISTQLNLPHITHVSTGHYAQHSPMREPEPTSSTLPSKPMGLGRSEYASADSTSVRPTTSDAKISGSKPYAYVASPRSALPHSPYQPSTAGHPSSGPLYHHQPSSNQPNPHPHPHTAGVNARGDNAHHAFGRPTTHGPPYGDTIKRHLDIYDADLAFDEIAKAAASTLEFSTQWSQRYHQSNRTHSGKQPTPTLQEIDDMIRSSQRVLESLGRVREVVLTQQVAISEEHARRPGGPPQEQYRNLMDDYKAGGGYGGNDAKKRRGKAAPPGRCHSCNRAETPEWRRGPDGARTLCNACGLHYAKITRKMGANKPGSSTGSALHPNGVDSRT